MDLCIRKGNRCRHQAHSRGDFVMGDARASGFGEKTLDHFWLTDSEFSNVVEVRYKPAVFWPDVAKGAWMLLFRPLSKSQIVQTL